MSLVLRLVVLGFYLAAALSAFLPWLIDYQSILLMVTGILCIAHLGEYVFVKNKLKHLDGNHFVNTLLFGVIYWLPLIKSKTNQPAK